MWKQIGKGIVVQSAVVIAISVFSKLGAYDRISEELAKNVKKMYNLK